MRKLIFIVFGCFIIPYSLQSAEVKPKCNAKCYWDYQQLDCFIDGAGPQCGGMAYPDPYSCYTPCSCCVIVTPD